ncbi:A24 family peptidase [Desulfosporosinus sp. I2]|uniref:prepilin peptidase n=1 Tax=Desulfosporosinus sp. I2 TaxID=1617025 RepID=UPI001FA6E87D|nr:A24 family peptidase [Desulfosporosinus sp. I2]
MMLLLYAIPMICAAITDWKKRIIPDWTWIAILMVGFASAVINGKGILYIPLLERFTGLLFPAVSLLMIAFKWGGVGGGDIKLMAALGFCFGLYGLAAILFFAVIPACIYARATKQRSVPLAVFLCIGFFVYAGLLLS